jgi:hypothetical protein
VASSQPGRWRTQRTLPNPLMAVMPTVELAKRNSRLSSGVDALIEESEVL